MKPSLVLSVSTILCVGHPCFAQGTGPQPQAFAYSQALQACYEIWQIGAEAKALLRAEPVEQVEADLVRRHAYGPADQAYQGSEDAANVVRGVVLAEQMSPSDRAARGLPDFASQGFMDNCPEQARKQAGL